MVTLLDFPLLFNLTGASSGVDLRSNVMRNRLNIGPFIVIVIITALGCSSSYHRMSIGDSLVVVTTIGNRTDTGSIVVTSSQLWEEGRRKVISTRARGTTALINGPICYESNGNIEFYQSEFRGTSNGRNLVFPAKWVRYPIVTKNSFITNFESVPDSLGSFVLRDTAMYLGEDTVTIDSILYSVVKIMDSGDASGGPSGLIHVATLYWYAPAIGYFVRQKFLSGVLPLDARVTKVLRH